jgi:hypothetical protein
MPLAALPFVGQESGLEPLGGGSPRFLNVVFEAPSASRAEGAPLVIRQRPGIANYASTASLKSITGLQSYDSDTAIAVDAQGFVYQINAAVDPPTVTTVSTGVYETSLHGALRPVLARTKTRVALTNGLAPSKWTAATNVVADLGGLPPASSHIVPIATRLVSNKLDAGYEGIIYWSYAGETGHETWDQLNFAEAEANPDRAVALGVNSNELFVFGERTLQVFAPDANTGFAPGRTLNLGCSANYSPVLVDEEWMLLDNLRRFVKTDGRSYEVVSTAIAQDLYDMSSVSDGWGFRAAVGRSDVYGCVFPSAGRTYVYQPAFGAWSQWASTTSTGELTNVEIYSAHQWTEQNTMLVGLGGGRIGELTASRYLDVDAAGESKSFPVEIQSGFINHGTDSEKECRRVKFLFLRGSSNQVAASVTEMPRVGISWRDDQGAWSDVEYFDLGVSGDTNPVIELRALGTYVRRQWRIQYTSIAAMSFIGAEEEFEVLTR